MVLGESTGQERSVRAASLLEHGFNTHAWRTLLQNATVETLPVAADAKSSVTVVRENIASLGCGGRRRGPAAVAKVRQKRQEIAARQQQRAAGTAQATAAVTGDTPAPATTARRATAAKKVTPAAEPAN